jgi:hypothetical protein
VKIKVSMVSLPASPELIKADNLLKKATAKKKSGDINGAIEALRASYKILNEQHVLSTIETYLRLPLYLQEAGRTDEAWREFNELIMWVNRKPRYSPEVTPMEQSIIWDKMRLFLQREGRNSDAVEFAVWAYLSWAAGLYAQKREEELKAHKTKENIQKALKAVLSKANKESLTDRLTKIISDTLGNLPIIDYKKVAEAIREEMGASRK